MGYAETHLAQEAWASCMREPRGVVLPRVLQDRDWMERAFRELIELDQRRPYCFLHSDTHIGNMYTEASGRPGFLDWQVFRKGPWAHDVTYFIVSALDLVDRRQWEKPLLAHYLARLQAYGVKPPDFEDAWLAYRQQIIWGLFFWSVNPLAFQPEAVDTVYSARFGMAAIDVGTREVIG
jgi:aminoglycoside phosphotransferase (APT) family kinase protein